jgi:DNA-directed RNA polymerase subunit N (RpoN/RPB10)
MLMTGLHTVCDIYCISCQSVVGWKYVKYNKNLF